MRGTAARLQGDRVWLWEDEQYLPSTVSSCSGGVVVFATDYGQGYRAEYKVVYRDDVFAGSYRNRNKNLKIIDGGVTSPWEQLEVRLPSSDWTEFSPEKLRPDDEQPSDSARVVFELGYLPSVTCAEGLHLQAECTHPTEGAAHAHSSIRGVEDMASLEDLHDGAIMHNLFLRYQQRHIYTYIGSILAAVNPYQSLPGLYDRPAVETYSRHHLGEISPHIFAVANECYRSLWKRLQNQCVLISGESGAGKTESTKLILKFLSCMSQHSLEVSSRDRTSHVEEALLESSPIMEAFGNAKTVYNNNSSRLGSSSSCISARRATSREAGLLTNRVVRQNPGERNYHIFYALLAGTNTQQKEAFGLTHPDAYHYLRQSSCLADKTINDTGTFQDVLNSMRTMQFTEENIGEILRLLAGILHAGNIEFMTAGGAQAVDSRDSMAMALYSQCFQLDHPQAQHPIRGKEDFKSISILDIFGFENFEVNRFEQFNINYANEKLQEYFNKHIFSLEQLEYNKEGLVWVDINWMDNGECLDLIEKKLGLLALMNEESHFPKATDDTLLEKLHSQHSVVYDVRGMLEKNRDTFRDDILNLLRESRLDFVYDLFEHVLSRNKQDTLRSTSKHRRPTVSSQFKGSLHSLMATLSTSNPFFIRCIKPNTHKMPDQFDQTLVLNQLRYSGMLETVKIRRTGFPIRRHFQDFCSRYKVLMRDVMLPDDPKGSCIQLLHLYDSSSADWQLGKTKVRTDVFAFV
ncbi:Unconventional myosin-X Unconventional myosin-10 [Larimichthys crocea]|uniref:Unconventional myosin-X Unconventional myosin-10 n=1 Tax=Larimichthys crocea TaxID=215358 RepID=A0A6G0IGR8_LARCR|nr:Unconventional myosin-X Unconventional myosin-10 [Larimichthys crocea]